MSINWNEWTYPPSIKYVLPVMKCWYVNDAIWKFAWGWKGVITEVSAQESHIVKYRVVWSIVINLSSTFIYTHCDTVNTTTISSWCLDWHWIIAVISEETMSKLSKMKAQARACRQSGAQLTRIFVKSSFGDRQT